MRHDSDHTCPDTTAWLSSQVVCVVAAEPWWLCVSIWLCIILFPPGVIRKSKQRRRHQWQLRDANGSCGVNMPGRRSVNTPDGGQETSTLRTRTVTARGTRRGKDCNLLSQRRDMMTSQRDTFKMRSAGHETLQRCCGNYQVSLVKGGGGGGWSQSSSREPNSFLVFVANCRILKFTNYVLIFNILKNNKMHHHNVLLL